MENSRFSDETRSRSYTKLFFEVDFAPDRAKIKFFYAVLSLF